MKKTSKVGSWRWLLKIQEIFLLKGRKHWNKNEKYRLSSLNKVSQRAIHGSYLFLILLLIITYSFLLFRAVGDLFMPLLEHLHLCSLCTCLSVPDFGLQATQGQGHRANILIYLFLLQRLPDIKYSINTAEWKKDKGNY